MPPREELTEVMTRWTTGEREKFDAQLRQAFDDQAERLRELGVWDEMSDAERKFMRAAPLEIELQTLIDHMWLSESAVCLLWALGYVDRLPPYDQKSDPSLANQLPRESMKDLEAKVALRPASDIRRQRDSAELWHWRSRTRRLQEDGSLAARLPKGQSINDILRLTGEKAAADGLFPAPVDGDFPAFGKAYREISEPEYFLATSIAIERHRAFNWLCGQAPGNIWAQTPTDT